MDLIDRRKGLSEALSRHDVSAVKGYLHPSFVVRGSDEVVVIDRAELVRHEALKSEHPTSLKHERIPATIGGW